MPTRHAIKLLSNIIRQAVKWRSSQLFTLIKNAFSVTIEVIETFLFVSLLEERSCFDVVCDTCKAPNTCDEHCWPLNPNLA